MSIDRDGQVLRWTGIASSLLYFASIAMAYLFYPGFDLCRQVSSELGGASSPHPVIFNTGLTLFGIAIILTAIQLRKVLCSLVSPPVRTELVSAILALFGLGTIGAGIWPLPDWKHAAAASLGLPNLISPWLLSIALRDRLELKAFRAYLVGTNVAIVLAMVINVVLAQMSYPGLGQLIYAVAAIPWIGISACVLSGIEKQPTANPELSIKNA